MCTFPFKRLGTVGVLLFTAQDAKTLASIPETQWGGKNKAFNQEQRALGASHISAAQACAPGQHRVPDLHSLVCSGSGRGCSVPHQLHLEWRAWWQRRTERYISYYSCPSTPISVILSQTLPVIEVGGGVRRVWALGSPGTALAQLRVSVNRTFLVRKKRVILPHRLVLGI